MFINSANASTLAGGSGWRVASTVANGVGVTVNGAKDVIVNGAKKTMTGVANVTPTAGQVGKFMGKNLGAAAVVGAMDLLLDGVDYVMDPVNNSINYKPKNFANLVGTGKAGTVQGATYTFASAEATYISYMKSTYGFPYPSWMASQVRCVTTNAFISCWVPNTYVVLANLDSTITNDQRKSISLANIGSQVINQAQEEVKTGNPAVPIATPVTQAAATAVVGEAATDQTQARPITSELDKSAAIPTDETAVGEIAPPTTNPDTGEVKPGSISLDFPVFCSWAPSMCVLADKVQEAITDAREWVKESETTDTELDIPEQEQQETDTNITFNGSCPAKITLVNFNYHGNQQNWEVDFTDWCSAVTTYIKPIVISMGAFSAVLIVSGVRINE